MSPLPTPFPTATRLQEHCNRSIPVACENARLASCVADQRAYHSARWTYVDGAELLARDGLFWFGAAIPTLVASATATAATDTCSACGAAPPKS